MFMAHSSSGRDGGFRTVAFGMAHPTSGRDGGFNTVNSWWKRQPETGPVSASHKGIRCDGCGMDPVIGVRYKCSHCANFDFCEQCLLSFESGTLQHGPRTTSTEQHLFLRVPTPQLTAAGRMDLSNRECSIHNVSCSGCGCSSIAGFRYSCQLCVNVHLCEACESLGTKHDPTHPRLKACSPQVPEASPAQPKPTQPVRTSPFQQVTGSLRFGMLHSSSGRNGGFGCGAFTQGPATEPLTGDCWDEDI